MWVSLLYRVASNFRLYHTTTHSHRSTWESWIWAHFSRLSAAVHQPYVCVCMFVEECLLVWKFSIYAASHRRHNVDNNDGALPKPTRWSKTTGFRTPKSCKNNLLQRRWRKRRQLKWGVNHRKWKRHTNGVIDWAEKDEYIFCLHIISHVSKRLAIQFPFRANPLLYLFFGDWHGIPCDNIHHFLNSDEYIYIIAKAQLHVFKFDRMMWFSFIHI